jgi:hypothetical protein
MTDPDGDAALDDLLPCSHGRMPCCPSRRRLEQLRPRSDVAGRPVRMNGDRRVVIAFSLSGRLCRELVDPFCRISGGVEVEQRAVVLWIQLSRWGRSGMASSATLRMYPGGHQRSMRPEDSLASGLMKRGIVRPKAPNQPGDSTAANGRRTAWYPPILVAPFVPWGQSYPGFQGTRGRMSSVR